MSKEKIPSPQNNSHAQAPDDRETKASLSALSSGNEKGGEKGYSAHYNGVGGGKGRKRRGLSLCPEGSRK